MSDQPFESQTPEFVLDDAPVLPSATLPSAVIAVPSLRTVEILPSQAIEAGRAHAVKAAAARSAQLAADPSIPALPAEPKPQSRYGRRWVDPADAASAASAQPVVAPKPGKRPAPEGFWREYAYGATLGLVNLGDSRAVRRRKAIAARIAAPVSGGARFVPVISRQGGVGATTVTTLLGMAMADARGDRVLALDAHPDRGTLADRVSVPDAVSASVRDVADRASRLASDDDLAALTMHDATGLEVLASSVDPLHERVLDVEAYEAVTGAAASRFGVVLTDGATGLLEPLVTSALDRADVVVVVSGGTAEQARLASETVSWLEENDHGELAENAVVAINTATPGTRYESLDAIEAHFQSRVRAVVRVPYDEELVAGAPVRYGALRPDTREAARDLAALVMDGVR